MAAVTEIHPTDVFTSVLLSRAVYGIKEDGCRGLIRIRKYNNTDLFVTSVMLKRNLVGMPGFISIAVMRTEDKEKKTTAWVAFEGTQDPEFWLYNMDIRSENVHRFSVHKGYLDMAKTVFDHIANDKGILELIFTGCDRIIFTGHSAGGAIAGIIPMIAEKTLAKIKTAVIDFGSPRYRLASCTTPEFFPRYRFQHIYDIVPCLPLRLRCKDRPYRHTGKAWFITPGGQVRDIMPFLRRTRLAAVYTSAAATMQFVKKAREYHSIDIYTRNILSGFNR